MAKTNFNTLAGLSIAVTPQILIKLKSCDMKFDMKFENHSHLHSVYPCLDTDNVFSMHFNANMLPCSN